MKTLSKQQVDFIDHYLEYSGIQFADVRLELTDHVASEVERKIEEEKTDFRTAFKDYMAVHKRELIKSKRSFMWAMDKKVLLNILKNILRPEILLIAVLLFFGYRQVANFQIDLTHGTWLWVSVIYSTGVSVLFFISKSQNFLGAQRLALQWTFMASLPLLFVKPYLSILSLGDQLFMAYFILINVSLFYTGLKMHRDNRNNYQLS